MLDKFVIVYFCGHYRYVDHSKRLATTGFKTKEKLLEYSSSIRFDKGTLHTMIERYNNYYGEV